MQKPDHGKCSCTITHIGYDDDEQSWESSYDNREEDVTPINCDKNYKKMSGDQQVTLNVNYSAMIPDDAPVRLIDWMVDKIDLTVLYDTYQQMPPRDKANPRQMLKICLLSSIDRAYSVRDISRLCERDIHFMWLLDGKAAPHFTTVDRFVAHHFRPCARNLMAQFTMLLFRLGEIDDEALYIDGTIIEGAGNRFKVVYKKSVEKRQANLIVKLESFVKEVDERHGFTVTYNPENPQKALTKLQLLLEGAIEDKQIKIVSGKGHHKTPEQRDLEKCVEYETKLKQYEENLRICGDRGSYNKTDIDATMMPQKWDHRHQGPFFPSYNIQGATNSGYVVDVKAYQTSSDNGTFKDFLEQVRQDLAIAFKKIIVDSGYESEENYLYIEDHGQLSFIKPSNYEQSKKRAYKNDIGRRENMAYDPEQDAYTCANGKQLVRVGTHKSTAKSGYVSEKTVYECSECSGCPYKDKCIKAGNFKKPIEERFKRFEVSKIFIEKREKNLERLESDEGIRLRVNRSIMSEGLFSAVKHCGEFDRFTMRSLPGVEAQFMMIAMARNIKVLHNKVQNDRTGVHLLDHPEKDAK